ncbi:MAG: hypothetical protein RL758_1539 [Pseudomonadota bacterium]|jgi:SM-20-related protein
MMFCKEIPGFLGNDLSQKLLQHVLANEGRFSPSLIGDGNRKQQIDSYRKSLRLEDVGDFREVFWRKTNEAVQTWARELGLAEFEISGLELELVAHGDGAFYKRHVDLFTGSGRDPQGDRTLSLVYYFHREPKAFEGGQLRLYPKLGMNRPDAGDHIDVQPDQDKAAIFSSWMAHEVMPITCPSGQFADSRFALNCWMLSKRG